MASFFIFLFRRFPRIGPCVTTLTLYNSIVYSVHAIYGVSCT